MARITVEDCLKVVPNRFDLTLLAAKRARALASGLKEPTVEWDNDKPTVVALREIASGKTDFSDPAPETAESMFPEAVEIEEVAVRIAQEPGDEVEVAVEATTETTTEEVVEEPKPEVDTDEAQNQEEEPSA